MDIDPRTEAREEEQQRPENGWFTCTCGNDFFTIKGYYIHCRCGKVFDRRTVPDDTAEKINDAKQAIEDAIEFLDTVADDRYNCEHVDQDKTANTLRTLID